MKLAWLILALLAAPVWAAETPARIIQIKLEMLFPGAEHFVMLNTGTNLLTPTARWTGRAARMELAAVTNKIKAGATVPCLVLFDPLPRHAPFPTPPVARAPEFFNLTNRIQLIGLPGSAVNVVTGQFLFGFHLTARQ